MPSYEEVRAQSHEHLEKLFSKMNHLSLFLDGFHFKGPLTIVVQAANC